MQGLPLAGVRNATTIHSRRQEVARQATAPATPATRLPTAVLAGLPAWRLSTWFAARERGGPCGVVARRAPMIIRVRLGVRLEAGVCHRLCSSPLRPRWACQWAQQLTRHAPHRRIDRARGLAAALVPARARSALTRRAPWRRRAQ